MKRISFLLIAGTLGLLLSACDSKSPDSEDTASTGTQDMKPASAGEYVPHADYLAERKDIYATFTLTADIDHLSDSQKQMLGILVDASRIMDDLYWQQAWGDKDALLDGIADADARRFADINYGPWDRLNNDKPFIQGIGEKPLGANFYPADMTKAEFDAWEQPGKRDQYSLVRRDGNGNLILVPYHDVFAPQLERAAGLLREAADLADNEAFANYLRLRADAFVSGKYQPSDMAWMDMKDNPIELVIGPIETYEDRLYGYRTSFESYILIKDLEWSERLARFAQYLPELQEGLPVADEYKQERPGSDADLNAYDAIYYAGHSNAGSKTIAINLPNDEEVQLEKGTRRLQLKNAMRAKFDRILVPIADLLIAEDQRQHITFDAFFSNTMFHEVAHGLGIKNTINDMGTVREALQEYASPMEEGKADILGLYMITELHKRGELPDTEIMDYYTTFLAGIFRSSRFGASSAHGQANMVRFNYFRDAGAFERSEETGRYRVNAEKMQQAVQDLSNLLLTLQGDGDYAGVDSLMREKGVVGDDLQHDLDRINAAGIPVDIVFKQGKEVLGLQD